MKNAYYFWISVCLMLLAPYSSLLAQQPKMKGDTILEQAMTRLNVLDANFEASINNGNNSNFNSTVLEDTTFSHSYSKVGPIRRAPQSTEAVIEDHFCWEELSEGQQLTHTIYDCWDKRHYTEFYYYDWRSKDNSSQRVRLVICPASTRVVPGYANVFPADGTYPFNKGQQVGEYFCEFYINLPYTNTVAPYAWHILAGGDRYSGYIYDAYKCTYYDKNNKMYYLNSGSVTIQTKSDGTYITIAAKGGTGQSSTNQEFNITITPSCNDDITIPLTNNLVWNDNTKADSPWQYLEMVGSGTGSDSKYYNVDFTFKTGNTTGTFYYNNIDWTKTYIRQGNTSIGISSVTSIKVTSPETGKFHLEATIIGSDGKTYIITGDFTNCDYTQSQGGTGNIHFSYGTDKITSERWGEWTLNSSWWEWKRPDETCPSNDAGDINDYLNHDWIRVAAVTTSKSTKNYVQLMFWTEDFTHTYSNGSIMGPKEGTYIVKQPKTSYEEQCYWMGYYQDFFYLDASDLGSSVVGNLPGEDYGQWYYDDMWFYGQPRTSSFIATATSQSPNTAEHCALKYPSNGYEAIPNGSVVVVSRGKNDELCISVTDPNGNVIITIGTPTSGGGSGSEDTKSYKLDTYVNGKGSVTKNPDECFYPAGSTVTLTPTPESGWHFSEWTGTCKDNITPNADGKTYTYTVPSKDCSVIANFVQRVEKTDNVTLCSNELPYTWRKWNKGGKTISSIAQQGLKDTVKTGDRIDSIVTLNLTIHQAYYPNMGIDYDSLTIKNLCACDVQSYTWNSHTFTEYEHIIDDVKLRIKDTIQTKKTLCDSVVILDLTIIPIDTTISSITRCANDFPFDWLRVKEIKGPEQNGDTLHLMKENGCYTVYVLDLHILPVDTTYDTVKICGFPFEWIPKGWSEPIATIESYEDLNVQNKGWFNTLGNIYGCDSIVQLVIDMAETFTMPTESAIVCTTDSDYYIWQSHEHLGKLTKANEYKDTTHYVQTGCDSAYYTLNLRFVDPVTEKPLHAQICTGGYYDWAGHPKYAHLTEQGEYKDTTLSKVSKCDSIYHVLQLSIITPKDSLTIDTICSDYGEDYYWEAVKKWIPIGNEDDETSETIGSPEFGNVKPYDIHDYDTIRSVNGCDSIRFELKIHVVPVVQDAGTAKGCKPSFIWTDPWGDEHEIKYDETPTYYESEHVEQGLNWDCTSYYIVSLEWSESIVYTDVKNTCSGELPYLWHGLSISTPLRPDGTHWTDTVHGATIDGCDSIYALDLTVHQSYTEDENTDIQLGDKYINQGKSFPFCGIDLTETGFYKDTIKTLHTNCDSVVSVNLIVLNNVGQVYDTICQGETYHWKGKDYTEPGDNYRFDTLTVHGTDSVVILHLAVNPTYNVSDPKTVCDNAFPFDWNGVTIASAADNGKQVTLSTIHNCDSVVTLALTVNPTYNVSDPITKCASELPFTWNGETIASAADNGKQVTLSTIHNCDSVVTLALTVNPTYNVSDPRTVCDNDFPFDWNGETIASAADNGKQVTLSTIHSCDSVVTLLLTVNPTYNVSDPITKCDNDFPFDWNGETITSAADNGKQVTLPTIHNCDSVVTLALTVNPTYNVSDPITKCASELPFTWNGVTIASAADNGKQVTLSTIHNCDSVVTLALTVNPTYNVSDPITKCASELPFTWNGETIASAADNGKQVTLPTIHNCDSVVTLALTVNPTYNVTDPITKCESALPFTWNGETIASAADNGKQVTLSSIHHCDSVVTLALTITNTLRTTDYLTKCDNELPFTWNEKNIRGMEDDGMQAILTSTAGCDSIVTLSLTVYPTYNVSDPRTVCDNAFPFDWNGETITSAADNGKQVTLSTIHHCDSVVTLALTVNPTYHVSDPITKCASELPFTWNGETIASAADNGKQVTLSTIHNCDSVVTLALTVNPTYDVTDPITKCESALPFTWNGETIASAADNGKQVTLSSIHHCDSVVTLALTITSTLRTTDYLTKCDNELPFTWNEKNIRGMEDDGMQAILTSTAGCDSIVTLSLTVYPTYNVSDPKTVCDNAFPFDWNGVTITSAADNGKQVTLPTIHNCDSVVTLALTVNPTYHVSDPITKCASELPFTWNGETIASAADNGKQVTLSTIHNCDSVVTLALTVNPTYKDIQDGKTICTNQLPYTWEGVTFTEAGSKTKTLHTIHGCDSVVTFTLIVNDVKRTEESATCCQHNLPYMWNGIACTEKKDYIFKTTTTTGCDSIVTLHFTPIVCICDPVEATMKWDSICANQTEMKGTLYITKNVAKQYAIHYPQADPNGHFKDVPKTDLPDMNKVQTIVVPFESVADSMKYIRPNDYTVEVTLWDSCGTTSMIKSNLHVRYPSWIIAQRWNDVLALYNEQYNGGYRFDSISWYLNGSLIGGQGENNSYVYNKGQTLVIGGSYWASLRREGETKAICTCPFVVTNHDNAPTRNTEIQIVRRDYHSLTLDTELSGRYILYDVCGRLLQDGYFGEDYQAMIINLPSSMAAGTYLITFRADDGTTSTQKVLLE